MLRKQYFDNINHHLAVLSTKIKQSNSLNLTDDNNWAESFYRDFLNICFKYNLVNLNALEQNASAIDLVDDSRKLAIQVTSTNTTKKIKDTVEGFIRHKRYVDYDRLIILLLVEKKKYQAKSYGDSQIFQLNVSNDIWDISNLLSHIKEKEPEELEKISDFLDSEFNYHVEIERKMSSKDNSSNSNKFSGAVFNNCQVNTGSGDQNNTINQNQMDYFEQGKRMFQFRYFDDSAECFYKDIKNNLENYESYIYYCISELASMRKISNLNEKIVNRMYGLLENIKSEQHLKLASYLWGILYLEYSEPRSKNYERKKEYENKKHYILKNPLSPEEKILLENTKPLLTEKAKLLTGIY